MNNKLISSIYEITKNLRDPVNNISFDHKNSNFKVFFKDGNLNITINIEPENIKKYEEISEILKKKLISLNEILNVNIVLTSEKKQNKEESPSKFKVLSKNIIAIASGKGGVGKSTFAVNYAVTLKELGFRVGILDADIYGPSVPRMMGINGKPEINDQNKMIPLENYGVKCMSIGFLIDVDTPAVWRGPMVMKALEQMFNGVDWGELDFLIIDLPPGTGDAQLTLAQSSKINGSIIVSTPQDVALIDVRKGINMFNKVNVPILGIVENMSYFICSNCKTRHEIFSSGGVKKEAEKYKTIFLGELPIDLKIRVYSDEGKPICISEPKGIIANEYKNIAKKINTNFN